MPRQSRLRIFFLICGVGLLFGAGVLLGPALSQERPPAPPEDTTGRENPLPGGAPEIAGYTGKVVFVLDRSGSMAWAGRFETGLAVLDQLVSQLGKGTSFDVYLAGAGVESLFEGGWLKATRRIQRSIRERVEKAGGVAYAGFTDIAGAVEQVAKERRPDAIYLISDGVQTLDALATDRIVERVVAAAQSVDVALHTIGIGPGLHHAESKDEATEALRRIASQTGGMYREAGTASKPLPPTEGRAFLLHPPQAPPPPEVLAQIGLRTTKGKEIRVRGLAQSSPKSKDTAGDYVPFIDDPALVVGPTILEYASVQLVVRTYADDHLFFESRPIPLKGEGDRLVAAHPVCFVGVAEESTPHVLNKRGALEVRTPGGYVRFVYKRGQREFFESAIVLTTTLGGRR